MKNLGLFFWVPLALLIAGCFGPIATREPGGGEGFEVQESGECKLKWEDEGLCLSTEWIEKPSADKKSGELVIRFWNPKTGGTEAGPYTAPKKAVTVVPFMTVHGHGTPVETLVQPLRDDQGVDVVGVFRARPVYLSMRGEWEIRIGSATLHYKY